MSPSRRTPPNPGPSRRPKVAGLRKPAGSPSPTPRPSPEPVAPDSEVHEHPEPESVESPESVDSAESVESTAKPEPEHAESEHAGSEHTGSEHTEPEQVGEVHALTGEPDPAPRPKPSPRRKARDTGTAKPSSEDETEAAHSDTESDAEPPAAPPKVAARVGARSRKPLVAGLLVVAVLFAGLAVFFRVQGAEAASATNNTALIDVARTSQVKEQVSDAVERLFSYDYQNIEKTEKAAQELLVTDEVREKYEKQFAEVKRVAPEQKMVVTTKVTRSGVMMLDDNRARVLVFVDQTSTRTDQNQTSAGGSQLSVEAEFRDGSWKITDMNTYNDLPQPPPAEDSAEAPEGE